jgi:hypothetical protein
MGILRATTWCCRSSRRCEGESERDGTLTWLPMRTARWSSRAEGDGEAGWRDGGGKALGELSADVHSEGSLLHYTAQSTLVGAKVDASGQTRA